MKKHIVLFSSLLLVGTAMTVGALEANASSINDTTKATRAEINFFEDGVGYKNDASLGNNEVMVYSHYFNVLPENVVIPEKIKDPKTGTEYTVVSIGNTALGLSTDESDTVKSVTLPKTIKTIGDSAFSGRQKIETIAMSEGITSIGKTAFSGNTSLKTLNLPSTLKSIGAQAFQDCNSLNSIKIPNGVTELPQFLFLNCTSLVSVDIPDSVTTIGAAMFKGATSLQTVKLSQNLIEIPNSLFKDLTALKEISIPQGVTMIDDQAFSGATALAKVSLPSGLKTISHSAFLNTKSLTAISIPDSVTQIENSAFKGSGLKEVKIPSGITELIQLRAEAFNTNTIEKIVFTSPMVGGMYSNVFVEPVKAGNIFEGWLKDGVATTESLSKIAEKGNTTVTAKWKVDPNAPTTSKGTSDATITLKAQQPTGTISFGDVTADAKIVFKDVTLKGTEAATTTEDTAKSNAKVVVNDSRSDKSKGWTVQAKYQNTNFTNKGLKLSLKPTAASGTVSNVDLSTTNSTVFAKGTGQAEKYDIKLTPSLAIPANYTVGASAETTKIDWVLTPEE